MRPSRIVLPLGLAAALVPVLACDGGGEGRLALSLEAETTITDGIAAGSELEDIVDGWSVDFDAYVVSVADLEFSQSSGGAVASFPTVRVLDLRRVPGGSFPLVDASLDSGRWDHVAYSLVAPDAATVADASVDPTDLAAMVAGGCTYLVRGTLSNPTGESCPPDGACRAATEIDFELCVPATVRFSDCQAEGTVAPGFAIRSGGTTQAALTIHGDHLFFDSFPGGAEIVARRAQWLADADVDGNDRVDDAELRGITNLSALFPASLYSLANPPGGALTTAFDFLVAQMRTQGHFQGEGECAFVVD